jgi:hypothetical protein
MLFLIPGHIFCRVPNETPEICEIGKLLREDNFQNPRFTIQEDGCNLQNFEITTQVVEDMISKLQFRMAKVQIRLVKNVAVKAVLCLKGQEYSISGFPRVLLRDNSEAMSKMPCETMQIIFLD